ncbi:DUF6884 domain-containing protein [Pseudonocardia aurantiaca]|uniref:DUF6884 domain-containing protein n=1 Tax=Pseudonocardia aurantiaca TaxID=75290 RepID=A0ABW4FYV6_9PSEU
MADWRTLTQRLAATDTSLRLTWSELDSLVGGLPMSAIKHRAWWSGDRAHVHAWREAGFTIDGLVIGREVTFVRETATTDEGIGNRNESHEGAEPARDAVRGDVLLVTCVKRKLAQPAAAKDLYVSPLFSRARRYAESREVAWFILSAEHGLLAPHEWVSPYDRYLPDTPAHYRAAWGRWVAERLDLLVGPLAGTLIEIHAGATYLEAAAGPLEAKGARLLNPLKGLSMGHRLSWYDDQAETSAVLPPRGAPEDSGTASSFVTMLLDRSSAVPPTVFLQARGVGLRGPGLYSWWVDDTGAADLSRGLGLVIQSGLIYAGLAGATRWPSGKRSTNTLWSRIAGMHLGGRHEFSTFRRTLGSILAAADGHETIDESALTDWMLRHLMVRTADHTDPDVLGRLEAEVLKALDPPLNSQGMPRTPVRSRITELRRKYGRD